jgi:organic hydroperoxide reductase OsmC/OhrA
MYKFPIEFESSAFANGHFEKSWRIESRDRQALCAIPTEFGGAGGAFCPEDLFLHAIINCFIGTFKVYSRASKINFSDLNVKGRLSIDKDSYAKVMKKKCFLDINIDGVEKSDRIQTLVTKVLRDGYILNSVKTEIEYQLKINQTSES